MTGSEAHRPKRSLGQNFLVDGNLQRRIVRAVGADADDEVLEIGPGRGALTRHLVGTVRRLVLVELDDALAGALERDLGGRPDVAVLDVEMPIYDGPAVAARLVVGAYGQRGPLDRKPGRPFVGPAGKVLDEAMAAAGEVLFGPALAAYASGSRRGSGPRAVPVVMAELGARAGALGAGALALGALS